MIDKEKVGQLMLAFLEQIEDAYGEDAELGDAIIAAEISVPIDGTDGETMMNMSVRCTSDRPVIQAGLIGWAEDCVYDDDDD